MTIIAQPHIVILDGYRYPVSRTLLRTPTVGKRWWFLGRRPEMRKWSRLELHAFPGAVPVVIERVEKPGAWDRDWHQMGMTITLRHPRVREV